MTTTQIYYTPPGQTGTARFDVPGSNVANVALTEVFSPAFAGGVNTYHTRNTNNYYTWICDNPDVAYANVSMINWTPSIGNTVLVDYTFPNGGGTLSSTTSNISITGQWLVNRFAVRKVSSIGDAFYLFGVTSSPAYSGGDIVRVNNPGVIGDDPVWDNSPINTWQNSAVQTYNITPTANTFGGIKFYANVKNQLTSATAGGTSEGNVLIAFEYTYSRSYEVNLHSATATLTSDARIGQPVTSTSSYFEAGTENLSTYFDGDYAGAYVASQDLGGYTFADYVADQVVTVGFTGVLAGLEQTATATATIATATAITTDFRLGGQTQATIASTTEVNLAGVVFDAAATVQAATELSAQPGYLQQATTTVQAETTLTESAQNIKGLNAVLAESADAQAVVQNRIGISDGLGYIDIDYADLDYFLAGAGLTIAQRSQVSADANIIRSDGTITFEAAFDAVIRPGFRIDAGVVAAGQSEFEISPYTTAGTGILFAAAAALNAEAEIAQALFGIAIDNVTATAQVDSALQATSTKVIDGAIAVQLFDLDLTSDSESRPSILAAITIGDDGVLTATAFVDSSSRANIIGSVEFGPATGGYLLSADVEIVQQITSTFGETDTRIFYIDMYYATVVAVESRRYRTVAEARLFEPDPETRVNTCLEDARILVVDPETRQADPALLPTTLRNSKLFRIPV